MLVMVNSRSDLLCNLKAHGNVGNQVSQEKGREEHVYAHVG